MDETTALNLIAIGAALAGNKDVIERLSGRTMPEPMKRAFREIKSERKAGIAVRHWTNQLKVNIADGVLEGVIRSLEGKEERHAQVIGQWRACFERLD